MDRIVKDVHILRTMDEVKALADPLRLRLAEAFASGPNSTKHVAITIGENATKLYRHVAILEEAGLIELIDTRQKRGTLEKRYQAVARDFMVDRQLLEIKAGSAQGYAALFLSALEATFQEAKQSVFSELIKPLHAKRNAINLRQRLTKEGKELTKLLRMVKDGILECLAAEKDNEQLEHCLAVICYPIRKQRKKRK